MRLQQHDAVFPEANESCFYTPFLLLVAQLSRATQACTLCSLLLSAAPCSRQTRAGELSMGNIFSHHLCHRMRFCSVALISECTDACIGSGAFPEGQRCVHTPHRSCGGLAGFYNIPAEGTGARSLLESSTHDPALLDFCKVPRGNLDCNGH